MADKNKGVQLPQPAEVEVEFAQQLVERAKATGVSLVGPGGLLAEITRTVLASSRRSWMLTRTRPALTRRPAGGPMCVMATGPRRCRPRSDRCGSRSREIGRGRGRSRTGRVYG